jgi:S1-C subfamily serine protease
MFLISADGRIVTNHHVIAGAASAVVKLNNGAFFPVEGVIADDPEHDLAVTKVPGKGLPYLNLEDSESLAVGQHVLAIGSPLGLENSVSDGIVSGIRNEDGKSWIQTTAPVSHGNSGGPLLVMNGKVVGVVTWKAGSGENLNFAAPSKLIAPLLSHSSVQPLGTVPKTVPAARRMASTVGESASISRVMQKRTGKLTLCRPSLAALPR